MGSKDLNRILDSLNSFDCGNEKSDDDILGKKFDLCMRLNDEIEKCDLPSGSKEFQDAVNKCIKSLESCTLMVNELALFSSNETIEEIQTTSLKFLLLPALLGYLTLKVQNKELSKNLDILNIAEVYFKDFLHRCKNYEACKNTILNKYEKHIFENDTGEAKIPLIPTVTDLATTRLRKIELYKEKKRLQSREEELKPALKLTQSEEYTREYYLTLLERWIITVIDEMDNTRREKPILENIVNQTGKSDDFIQKRKVPENKPLKPFIITKDETQKKVFGMGYPSLPVMTIEDFYRQRFEKYIEEQKSETRNSLQNKPIEDETDQDQSKDLQKEELLEKDDPEELKKARDWDDWKDDNPRGSGNRKNKG